MKYNYHIRGMSCNGCRSHVEETLSKVEGVSKVVVNLEKAEATIDVLAPIPIEAFQVALKNDGAGYSIHQKAEHVQKSNTIKEKAPKGKGTGTFYCPMHCEGDKTYTDKDTKCPVCGMALKEVAADAMHTEEMHSEDMHEEETHTEENNDN